MERIARHLNSAARRLVGWLESQDPGGHGRIKGLRLVTAYGIAAMLGSMGDITRGVPGKASLATLAGGFALWASVSEGRATRRDSSRDLLILCLAAGVGAASFALLYPVFALAGRHGPEFLLISGAFCVGWLRRFGLTGTGVGSQIYIGQLLAYGAKLRPDDWQEIVIAVAISAAASIVQRILSGPAEHPPPAPAPLVGLRSRISPDLAMGMQAALGALAIVLLNLAFGLIESAWAITACTYVIAASATGTRGRVVRRILGTAAGVPIGLAFLPVADAVPVLAWAAAALAMVIYAMALPTRYDIACGAYAFTLIMTLAVTGEHSAFVLGARGWETVIGAAMGLFMASAIFPLRPEVPAAP